MELWRQLRERGFAGTHRQVHRFVADGMAVRAALTTSWSNGQAERQISRLKMFERTLYGRGGRPLLRRRVLLAE